MIATFSTLKQWEDRYRQLIMLAKRLPPLPEALRSEEIALSGCENRVWLGHQLQEDGTLHFYGDSEGRIVRGLLAVLLTEVEGKTPQQIAALDPLALFDRTALRAQLSATRASGGGAGRRRKGDRRPLRLTRRLRHHLFSACDTATKPKVAVTMVAAPNPALQSILFGPSAVLREAHTEPSGCG